MSTESNHKFLSIPPYISTSWKNIRSLRMEDTHLIVTSTDGSVVRVPNLDRKATEEIFAGHAAFLQSKEEEEELSKPTPLRTGRLPEELFGGGTTPFRFGVGINPENLTQALHHDSSQSHAPDLPPEILEKVSAISKVLVPPDANELPKAEPHCNCIHCQIARTIQHSSTDEDTSDDTDEYEEVTDDDLAFREWDIAEIGDQIHQVTNPLNPEESFKVCLTPVGCTCGIENCEHLLAVLRS